jgi:hypothetical protein
MAKATKKTAGGDSTSRERLRRIGIHAGSAFVALVALAFAMALLCRHVEKKLAFPAKPPQVVLKARPGWMSDLVAQQIATQIAPRGAHSAFDEQMLVEITRMLKTNPWIMKVRGVRRVYGKTPADTLEVDCDFRTPAALVKTGSIYYLIDRSGVRLPEQYAAADVPKVVETPSGRTNIMVIEGVARPAPGHAGQKWTGEDLHAALDLAALLLDPDNQPFTHDIRTINVANFHGRQDRREAQMVLVTRYSTQIRWGLPLKEPGFEIPPARKLAYMRQVVRDYGRVDGNQPLGIDIRYDKVTYPSIDPRTAQANSAGN